MLQYVVVKRTLLSLIGVLEMNLQI